METSSDDTWQVGFGALFTGYARSLIAQNVLQLSQWGAVFPAAYADLLSTEHVVPG